MTRKQPFTLEEFKSIYSRFPRLCVDLVIKKEKGTLLTLRQDNGWIGQWHLPGGTIYLKETVQETINRVAKEELGLELEVVRLLGYLEYPSEEKERGYGHSISLAFLCKPKSENITLDNQVSAHEFFLTPPDNTIAEQKEFLLKL